MQGNGARRHSFFLKLDIHIIQLCITMQTVFVEAVPVFSTSNFLLTGQNFQGDIRPETSAIVRYSFWGRDFSSRAEYRGSCTSPLA
jgi:hypothetical protein